MTSEVVLKMTNDKYIERVMAKLNEPCPAPTSASKALVAISQKPENFAPKTDPDLAYEQQARDMAAKAMEDGSGMELFRFRRGLARAS